MMIIHTGILKQYIVHHLTIIHTLFSLHLVLGLTVVDTSFIDSCFLMYTVSLSMCSSIICSIASIFLSSIHINYVILLHPLINPIIDESEATCKQCCNSPQFYVERVQFMFGQLTNLYKLTLTLCIALCHIHYNHMLHLIMHFLYIHLYHIQLNVHFSFINIFSSPMEHL